MPILVVGTVAFDSIQTPFGKAERCLGGSATYFSVAASFFTEIDLIARQGDLVTFIEVKTRRGAAFGSPLEAVTGAKRRELVKAARVWVHRFGRPPDIYRFDCIAIVDNRLEHLADAFRPGWR